MSFEEREATVRPLDDRAPVLVGIGTVEQRLDDPLDAKEPLSLMLEAIQRAGADSGRPELLARVDYLAVPRGRWRYEDPGRYLAEAIGSERAESILALVGVLQQSLIGEACQRIADGRADVALVVGGEAGYRRLRSRLLGVPIAETEAPGVPTAVLKAKAELQHPAEMACGLGAMPVGYYAIIESALMHRRGESVPKHRNEIAKLYSRFSEIAANNPHAWRREPLSTGAIEDATPQNQMLAFPYTKRHTTSWNVDQSAALLFCSAKTAEAIGVPPSQWIYPLASTESNYMSTLSEREDVSRSPGARIAGNRALERGGLTVDQLDFVDLYSCFPAAVQIVAEELGMDKRLDWTVTGGMPFAGGPFNSYVLQSTCRAIELMRGRPGSTALITSISGVMTKQGFGLWSTEPGPNPYAWEDTSAEVAEVARSVAVVTAGDLSGVVAGHTGLHADNMRTGVVLIDTDQAMRSIVSTTDDAVIALLESQDCCGRRATAADGKLHSIG